MAVSGAVRVAPADCTPRTARICAPKSGFAECTTITPIFAYVSTTVPPLATIAFCTAAMVRRSVFVLTTYANTGASAACAADSACGAAEAASKQEAERGGQ